MKERELTMKRTMETRAKLCPVCRWEEDDNLKFIEPTSLSVPGSTIRSSG